MSDVKTVYRVLKHEGLAHEVDRTLDRSVGSVKPLGALERLEEYACHSITELYRGETNPLPVLRFDYVAWKHHRAEMYVYRITDWYRREPEWTSKETLELFDSALRDAGNKVGLVL